MDWGYILQLKAARFLDILRMTTRCVAGRVELFEYVCGSNTHTYRHMYIYYLGCDDDYLHVIKFINQLCVLLIFKYCTTDQCWFHQQKRGFKVSFVMIHFAASWLKII